MFRLVAVARRGSSIQRTARSATMRHVANGLPGSAQPRGAATRRLLFLLVVLLAGTAAHAESPATVATAVTATDGSITMMTYEHTGRELQPPLFAGSALVGLYPFPTYKMPLKTPPALKQYKAIFIENEYLKLTYVPYFGGRFLSLYDKLRDREVFYKNDVIKPTQFNARGDWPQEGIELTGPFDVHSLTLDHDPYWSNTTLKNADGSITLLLGETDPFYGMRVTLSATLYPGVAALQIGVMCFNPNDSRMPQMIWTNASFPATPQTRFLYPMTRTVGHNTGQVTNWPMYQGVDYSWDHNNKNMLGVFGIDLYDNFGGAYQFDRDYGVFRFADRRVVQGMKMWTFGHGRDGAVMERSYTDKAGPYFEAQSGRHVWDGHYEWVEPHQVERWSEWWVPVAGTEGLSTLTEDLALNVRLTPSTGGTRGRVQVDLSAVRRIAGASLKVSSSQGELMATKVDLVPGVPSHTTVPAPEGGGEMRDISVTVTDEHGKRLLDYRLPNPGEKRSDPNDFAKELEKPARSQEVMTAEELVLTAEFRLKELDTKGASELIARALGKDPGYSSAHLLQGIIFYKNHQMREAEAELRKAVDRNAYSDQGWYYLALAEDALGERQAANKDFYNIWPHSAYFGNREYELGKEALTATDLKAAVEHLQGALNANGQDLSARVLLAMAYRLRGDAAEAAEQIAQTLKIDPSNREAYAERYFLTNDPTARDELKRLMGDQTQEALHVAERYSSLGRWKEASKVLQMEERNNADPWGTSAVFFYTLAYDLKQSGDTALAAELRQRAKESEAIVDRFPYLASSEAPLVDAVASDLTSYIARFDLGCLMYSLGRTDEAVDQWEAAVKLSPTRFGVQRALGLAYEERGLKDRAAVSLEAAVALDGTHLETVNDLASLYAAAGRFPDEQALLQRSLKLSPGNDDILLRLLQFYLVQGNYEQAREIVRTHEFSPRHRDTQLRDQYRALMYAEGSRAYMRGEYPTALKLFHEAEAPPASLGIDDFQFQSIPRLHYAVGRTLEAMHQTEQARQAYEQTVRDVDLTAGDRETWNSDNFLMVLALDRLGRTQEADALTVQFRAFAQSQLAAGFAHRRADATYLLALLAARAGHVEDARTMMAASLRIEPDFLSPRLDLRSDAVGTGMSDAGRASITIH